MTLAFNSGTCNFRKRDLKLMDRQHEVLCAVGRVAKIPRKVVVFVVYIPPNTRVAEFTRLSEALMQELASIRSTIKDPVIYVTGDFNERDLGPDLGLAGGLELIQSGPPRGTNTLDLIYMNARNATAEVRVLPPLDTAGGVGSDHRCVFLASRLGRERRFKWLVRMRRTPNQAREEAFASKLRCWDWTSLKDAPTVEGMVDKLEAVIASLTDKHFPLVRVRKRSNEDPWITRSIRRLWKKKIRIYKRAGKCATWWETDRVLQEEITAAKESFVERLLEDGGNGKTFYAATKKLAAATAAPPWAVTDLYVGLEPGQVCRQVLDFYGGIAKSDRSRVERDGLRIPGGLGVFTMERTEKRLKESRKTDSRDEGDPLPHLIRCFPDAFAGPVSEIYNRVNDTGYWPAQWKTEYLTVIPKVSNPADLSECRNIGCTSAFSKILEYQVLAKLRAELIPDEGQYGGVPKCGVEHLLLDLWEKILTSMEGGNTAAILLGVDYDKAFNRMEHDICLEQLRKLGALSGSISIVRAFLEERMMTIVINGHKAEPMPIQRGSPQGSVLGCLLYCVTTQNLTKDLRSDQPNPQFFPQSSSDDEEDIVFWSEEAGGLGIPLR